MATNNSMRKVPISSEITEPERVILAKIFRRQFIDKTRVHGEEFRRDNRKHLETIQELRRRGLLTEYGHVDYLISLLGTWKLKGRRVHGVDAHLRACSAIYRVLRKSYFRHLTAGMSVSEISLQANLDIDATVNVLDQFRNASLHAGGSTQLRDKDAVFSPSEQMRDYATFSRYMAFQEKQYANTSLFSSSAMLPTQESESISQYFDERMTEYWNKATQRCVSDPEGSITNAKSLVESVCKYILEDRASPISNNQDLKDLYKQVSKCLDLDVTPERKASLHQMLTGIVSIVNGIAGLRNHASDSHGHTKQTPSPPYRHAFLATRLAGALSSFLLEVNQGAKPNS